ncbi:MAG TPA: hypothetical protein VGJ22_10155 [Anaerolineales bacterium]|jgi:hypothetical protein
MFTWSRIVGLILALYALIAVVRGRITVGGEYERTTTWISRADKPVQFWLVILVLLALAAILLLNVFHF